MAAAWADVMTNAMLAFCSLLAAWSFPPFGAMQLVAGQGDRGINTSPQTGFYAAKAP